MLYKASGHWDHNQLALLNCAEYGEQNCPRKTKVFYREDKNF